MNNPMDLKTDYLRWAKTHPPARFELTSSGVPSVRSAEIGIETVPFDAEDKGAYGDPRLIEAIAKRYAFAADGIVPVPGASSGNFIAVAATVEHGDRVMVEHPVYQPIRRVASFLGLRMMKLTRRPDQSFAVDLDEVEAGLGCGVRAVVLTNLHNPSGQYLSREALRDLAQRCARTDAVLIVDEVYLDAACFLNGQPFWTAADLASNVVVINSLTKVYGLGGLRVGWINANGETAERARTVMDLLSVINASPSASLAIRAFQRIERLEQRYARFYEQGQAVYRRWLAGEPLVTGYDSHGAVFEFLKLPEGLTANRFTELLRTEYETQVTTGSFFGLDDHIRLSIALAPDDLAEALSRISQALRKLRPG